MIKRVLLVGVIAILTGCSTATYVKLPPGSVMTIQRGEQQPHSEGLIERSPFSWSSAGGIPYQLEKDGKVVSQGRMQSEFRPVSIFWPPAALLYWPMGFAYDCYDLTGASPRECSPATRTQLQGGRR